MLLLLQTYITYQQFPRGGGEVVTTQPTYEDTDDEMLMVWFTYMARFYASNTPKDN